MSHSRGMDTSFWQSLRIRIAGILAAAAPLFGKLRDSLRGVSLLVVGLAALWLIATPNPLVPAPAELIANPNRVKVGLIAWLTCKLSIAAYLGYWYDRLLHPRSRPGDLKDIERMAAEKRRAFIVCAAILAAGFFQ